MPLDYLISLLEKVRVISARVIFVDAEARIEISYKGRFASSYSTTSYHGRYVLGFGDYYRLKNSELPQQARRNFKYIEKRVGKELKSSESN